jgi:hypothetical protein
MGRTIISKITVKDAIMSSSLVLVVKVLEVKRLQSDIPTQHNSFFNFQWDCFTCEVFNKIEHSNKSLFGDQHKVKIDDTITISEAYTSTKHHMTELYQKEGISKSVGFDELEGGQQMSVGSTMVVFLDQGSPKFGQFTIAIRKGCLPMSRFDEIKKLM